MSNERDEDRARDEAGFTSAEARGGLGGAPHPGAGGGTSSTPPAQEDPKLIATGNTLADISIRNHVFAWMLMLGLIGFGLICFTGYGNVVKGLGVSQNPDVDFPVVNVSVGYEGASPEIMEGTPRVDRFVVLEFPSLAQARSWYESKEYRAVIGLRQRAAESELFFIEGYAAPA